MKLHIRQTLGLAVSLASICLSSLSLLPQLNASVEAAFAGYNGKVAFYKNLSGNREVHIMDSDGSSPARVTNFTGNDVGSKWSPDGTKIAFESYRDGNSEIYVMNAQGSNQVRLTTDSGEDGWLNWSPDGLKIAYSNFSGGNRDLYVMNADGSNRIQLTNANGTDVDQSWSPDSSKIVFTSARDGNNNVYVTNVDGSNQTRLTSSSSTDSSPAWSPDGSKIAFVSYRDGNGEVYVMDADGSDQTRVTNTASFDEDYISWSPDGTYIASVRMNLDWDESKVVIISFEQLSEVEFDYNSAGVVIIDDLVWSPDGKKLLITGYHESAWNTMDLYVLDSDGSNLVQLTSDGVSGYGDWQPVPNDAPDTIGDSLSVAFETVGTASVLGNDTDEETLLGSNLSVAVQPAHGSASVNAAQGKIEYTPANGYSGSDSLTYRICDSFTLDQKCSTAVLGISVGAPGAPSLSLSSVNGQPVSLGGTIASATAKPAFSGTASPNAEIKIEIHSDPIILTTTADGQGNWSVTPANPLPPGQHTVTISATLNGQTTTLDSFVLGIQAELPQAGASLLVLQIIGSVMVFAGYGLNVYDKRRRLRREVPAILGPHSRTLPHQR